jgi:ABC-type spermidine/putrescine transport system permease subunit II
MFLGPWGGIVALALLVVTYIVLAIAFWQFLKKAGLTPMVALLMLVPVVNLGVALWAAFAEWPVNRELSRLKLAAASANLVSGLSASADPTAAAPPAGTSTTPSG